MGCKSRVFRLQKRPDDYLWGYFDLDLKPNASHRLCRIKVDLTNEFDHAWKVDIRKRDVIPPPSYRDELKELQKAR